MVKIIQADTAVQYCRFGQILVALREIDRLITLIASKNRQQGIGGSVR